MKKILALVFILLLLSVMFSGCGGNANTVNTPKSTPTADNTNTKPEETPAATEEPEEKGPYNFAKGKFAVDERGFATEKYDYELPLTTTDEVLQYWTTNYTPEYLPMDYNQSPFPLEVEEKTGVHVEYLMVSAATRAENFSVLIAADELPDILSQAGYFYRGVFKDGITEEKFFVNLYDYRDYMPNYIYEVMKDAENDVSVYNAVFLEDEIIGSFYCLRDDKYPGNGLFIRGDWLKKIGMSRDDIVTWEDTYNMLKAFKSQIDTATYPAILFSNLAGSGHWICFDTVDTTSTALTQMIDANGKVYVGCTNDRDKAYMTEINKWYMEGLFDPNWAAFPNMTAEGFRERWLGDQFGYVALAVPDVVGEQHIIDDPETSWMPVADPVLEEGQTLHVGSRLTRLYYGSACISTRCNNIELAVTWLDWRYSPTGAEVMSYGAEGYAWEYNEKGEKQVTEFIYNNPEKQFNITMLTFCYSNNAMCDPGLDIVPAHYKYPEGEKVIECYQYYIRTRNNDEKGIWPAGLTLSAEQSDAARALAADIVTYINENYLAFVDGSVPLSKWDEYVAGLEAIGLSDYIAIYQEVYDAYLAEQA